VSSSAVATETDILIQSLMRRLLHVWGDFDSSLNRVPIIEKLNRGKFRKEDYQLLLLNLRQQVVEGACWISRAASHITEEYFDIRSLFIQHAATEHRDFKMLEENYVSVGGNLETIQSQAKNIGSEAFSAYMYHQASRENPFHLLGSMFIIEGLGNRKALEWGEKIQEQLGLQPQQVNFFLYHGENDESHMEQFDKALHSGFLTQEYVERIVKTAKVTARLYRLQLEELGNY
jgi:3-oxoacyl-[acyl-carrier-protein] synthase-3